ncbi:MAG: ATP-dependent DNA helicase, partial [Candidatus Krumholzibacteriia bacterium]
MTHVSTSPFPRDVVVVCRQDGVLRWRAFESGAEVATPTKRPALVLHGAHVQEGELRTWRHADTLVAPARTVLALLAPETAAALPETPAEMGRAYLEATSSCPPRCDLLQLALGTLPATAGVERALLDRALAAAATLSLQGSRPRQRPTPAAVEPGALGAADLGDIDPHVVLERCFEQLAAWRRRGGAGGLERRDGQVEMAHAVLDALLQRRTLAVEAGTGIGKSIAYALPAVLFIVLAGERAVVSTHTRNLQQQLVGHDLPELWSCFGLAALPRASGERRPLRFAKLLGRNNYVCRSALERWARGAAEHGGSLQAAQLVLAVLRTRDGVLEDLHAGFDPHLLRQLSSRRETCVGRACRSDPACPVYAARAAARGADLVVVNHALLLANGRSEGSILGDHGAVVVDEAHNLVRVATETFGHRLGSAQADALAAPLRRLDAERRALPESPEMLALRRRLGSYAEEMTGLRKRLSDFLATLDASLPAAARVPARQRYRDGDEVFGAVREELDALRMDLQVARRSGAALLESCRESVRPELAGALELLELLVEL